MKPPAWLWYFLLATITGALAHFPKYPQGNGWEMLRFVLYSAAVWFGLAGAIGLLEHLAQLYIGKRESYEYAKVAGERELLRLVGSVAQSIKGLPESVQMEFAMHLQPLEDRAWMDKWLDMVNLDPDKPHYLELPAIRRQSNGSIEQIQLQTLAKELQREHLVYERNGQRYIFKSRKAFRKAQEYALKSRRRDNVLAELVSE